MKNIYIALLLVILGTCVFAGPNYTYTPAKQSGSPSGGSSSGLHYYWPHYEGSRKVYDDFGYLLEGLPVRPPAPTTMDSDGSFPQEYVKAAEDYNRTLRRKLMDNSYKHNYVKTTIIPRDDGSTMESVELKGSEYEGPAIDHILLEKEIDLTFKYKKPNY